VTRELFPPRTGFTMTRHSNERGEAGAPDGGSADAPGHRIEWRVPQVPFHAVPAPGAVYDIGTQESLAACRAKFASGASGPAGASGGGNAG
jgi:hypothetical protein